MKYPIIVAVAIAAVISPVKAKPPSCIPECPFFHAWALTKVCPNLSLNEIGRSMVKTFDHGIGSESREILRLEMYGAKRRFVRASDGVGYQSVPDPDACNQCKSYDEDKDEEVGGLSSCRFLQWAKPRRIYP